MLACLETFLRGNSNSQAVVWICKQWNFWCHNILWKLALSPGFQIAAPLRKLLRIMSLCQVEKTLFWIVGLEVLLKIYLSSKKKLFCQLSTSYLNCFILVLVMMSGTLVSQHSLKTHNPLRRAFHSLSPGFQIAAPLRELLRIMSLFQVEKTLFWTVGLEVLLKIYLSKKRNCFVDWVHYTWIFLSLFLWWWVVLWCCKLCFSRKLWCEH